MLQLKIPDSEAFDERQQKFIRIKGQTLSLEHSLVSISKWEAKYKKPFLSDKEKTVEETIDYIRFMTITQNVDPNLYTMLTPEHIKQVMSYIEDPMTATTITRKEGQGGRRTITTSELIYYYMTAYQIPFDPCQKWHLNRLLMLIRVCDEKNAPKKKMSRHDIASQNRSLNAARRAKAHSRG